MENAFYAFGGVPKTLVIDNLKAAVAHPDWFDPELTPKVQSFCRHYGTVILPTKPYMPRHKGKVESGVKYVQDNALKGRKFPSNEAQNRYLADWETNVADTRIHGTTKRQVAKLFAEERPSLLPLPLERFPSFHEAQRKVNRDGHIEVAKAYYSVPPEYLGRTVWVRWDTRLVRIFNHRFEQIALHVRHEQGRFSTQAEHLAPEKINGIERGAAYLLSKVAGIGPQVATMGGSDAPCPRHRRDAGAARAVEPDEKAHRRSPGKRLRNRPFPRRLSPPHPSPACSTARPRNNRRCRFSTSIRSSARWTITAASSPPPCAARTIAAHRDGVRQGFWRNDEGVRGVMTKGPQETHPAGPRHVLTALDPDIPCRVAPQQSPTPFPRTLSMYFPPVPFDKEPDDE